MHDTHAKKVPALHYLFHLQINQTVFDLMIYNSVNSVKQYWWLYLMYVCCVTIGGKHNGTILHIKLYTVHL